MVKQIEDIEFPSRLFITGIDTDAGKSYATGWLARGMMASGKNVITQKFVQTGNTNYSEDIELHRKIMGCGMLDADINNVTAPEIFTYPCSPDLAAKIDNREIDLEKIARCSDELSKRYDYILIEGAGGLMVPLKDEYLTADYIKEHDLPIAIVTNGTLGSINHTLLTIEMANQKGLRIFAVIYNMYFDKDETISADTRAYIKQWLFNHYPETHYLEMPKL